MKPDRNGRALAAFIVGTALAGGNAVGVRVSNRELDPLWGAGLRFLLAALLLGAVMAVMRLTIPRGRALLGVLLYGTLIFGGAFSFTYGHQSQTLLAAAGRRAAKSRVERGRAASARGRRECGRARTSAHSFPLLALA
jgi:hypothetical protein